MTLNPITHSIQCLSDRYMCNDIFSHDIVIVSIPYFDVMDIMNGPQCEQGMLTLLRYPISSLVFTKVHVVFISFQVFISYNLKVCRHIFCVVLIWIDLPCTLIASLIGFCFVLFKLCVSIII